MLARYLRRKPTRYALDAPQRRIADHFVQRQVIGNHLPILLQGYAGTFNDLPGGAELIRQHLPELPGLDLGGLAMMIDRLQDAGAGEMEPPNRFTGRPFPRTYLDTLRRMYEGANVTPTSIHAAAYDPSYVHGPAASRIVRDAMRDTGRYDDLNRIGGRLVNRVLPGSHPLLGPIEQHLTGGLSGSLPHLMTLYHLAHQATGEDAEHGYTLSGPASDVRRLSGDIINHADTLLRGAAPWR